MQLIDTGSLGPVQVLKLAVQEFSDDGMSTHAAALAYRVLFALFPFLIFLVALVGFLHVPQLFDWLREQAAVVVPPSAMDQVNRVLGELRTPRGGLLSAGIIVAIWSASSGVLSAMDALNAAYDVNEARPTWKRILLSILYTVVIGIVLLVAAALMVLGPEAAGWVADKFGLKQVFVTLWAWLRWPVAALLLLLAVSLGYYLGPNVQQRFRFVTPGSLLAVVIWIAASIGFGFYVQHFANYNATYGSLGAVIILLFYFYLSAAVLLFGAEVNAVIESHAQQNEQKVRALLP